MLSAVVDGAVQLYHNNSVRVATTADGADISGTGSIKVPVGTTAQEMDPHQLLVILDITVIMKHLKVILHLGVLSVDFPRQKLGCLLVNQ